MRPALAPPSSGTRWRCRATARWPPPHWRSTRFYLCRSGHLVDRGGHVHPRGRHLGDHRRAVVRSRSEPAAGVLDTGIDDAAGGGSASYPHEAIAVDDAGNELLVADPNRENTLLDAASTVKNFIASVGEVYVFATHGTTSFTYTGVIADTTVDPYVGQSSLACSYTAPKGSALRGTRPSASRSPCPATARSPCCPTSPSSTRRTRPTSPSTRRRTSTRPPRSPTAPSTGASRLTTSPAWTSRPSTSARTTVSSAPPARTVSTRTSAPEWLWTRTATPPSWATPAMTMTVGPSTSSITAPTLPSRVTSRWPSSKFIRNERAGPRLVPGQLGQRPGCGRRGSGFHGRGSERGWQGRAVHRAGFGLGRREPGLRLHRP